MSYIVDKETGKITMSGFDKGIAPSPHKGIANMQNVNISTEQGEVMCSYARQQQSQTIITSGTLTQTDASHVGVSGTTPASAVLLAGSWIKITSTGITNLTNGNYYYVLSNNTVYQLSATYQGSAVGSLGTGTCTFQTAFDMGKPIATCTETYHDSSNNFQYRYYILDSNGRVFVNDTGYTTTGTSVLWSLPDDANHDATIVTGASGISVLNGYLFIFAPSQVYTCLTQLIMSSAFPGYTSISNGILNTQSNSKNVHFTLVDKSNTCYFTDSDLVGSIFPSSVSSALNSNIFSYGTVTFTGSDANLTTGYFVNGDLPVVGQTITFTSTGTLPTGFSANTVYYVVETANQTSFQVSGTVGGGAITPTGGSGTLYFNSFNPNVTTTYKASFFGTSVMLPLANYEVTQCLATISDSLVIGCKSNNIYLWDKVTATGAQDTIPLPENNSTNMITVNNMVYVMAGNKGNIYVTNGSVAAPALTVPDYCAGIAGTPSSYIEPYFIWGGFMYVRGRVYFSILDQTSAKAGNCGGVWSFIPTQNFFYGQDVGLSLRLENQNSYGTYNGVATVLIPSQNQVAISPQYFSGWYSSIATPSYGIDTTGTYAGIGLIETDLIPTGEILVKKSFENISYKLSAPLNPNESVSISYRQNGTDSYQTAGTIQREGSNTISGYITPLAFSSQTANLGQWIQLKITLNGGGVAASFVRLKEITIS